MMNRQIVLFLLFFMIALPGKLAAQEVDAATKLYLSRPDYESPYGIVGPEEIKAVTDRILLYLKGATPVGVIDQQSGKEITDYTKIDRNSHIVKGTFSLTNYTWGVTYSSMLAASEITGDQRYRDYVSERFRFLSGVAPGFDKVMHSEGRWIDPQMRQMCRPAALDDAGAMCSAMIKARLQGMEFDGEALIDRYFNFIFKQEYRLEDGTFARNRPQRNTIWLDDLYMGVPAIANMGRLTGDTGYYDEAIKQVLQFAERMFLPEKGLYRHGWVEEMDPHPSWHWGRANGWAMLAKVEVLDAIPEGYPGREKVLALLQSHIAGISSLQSGKGFWHQLLDRNDSYLETSCTAIFVYCMAHAINEGWIDPMTYGSQTVLGWHAVSTKVNDKGEVEGTCVGTGMGFDPAFYYYRPRNKHAGHGYGPVIHAGAEMYRLVTTHHIKMNDSALLFYREKVESDKPIFYLE
jgi:rhamnogalacturonyl hydrolase YesR